MGTGILSTGISGLNAAQAGLVATGHNITNASTPGYHRQSILQSPLTPLSTGSGFFGQGVQVETVVRAYSEFLDTRLAETQAQSAYYSAYHEHISQIDNLVADTQAGMSPALQEFFAATHAVANNPADISARQSLLSAGAALTSRYNTLAARLDQLQNSVNAELSTAISSANLYAQQIASQNERILKVQQDPRQPPNDLYDQRDLLVSKLSELLGTTVLPQGDGTVNIFIGNGQSMVVGNKAMSLAAAPSLEEPQHMVVGYSFGGNTMLLNSSNLQRGRIGGLLAFRASELDAAQNSLGRVALGLAKTFNDQNALGQDLRGVLGVDFFRTPVPDVVVKTTNTSGATISASVTNAGALTASDYRLTYDGSNYSVTRLSDNTTTAYATLPQTVDGVDIAVSSGVVASGDSFLIQPTRNAARAIAMNISDPAKIAAAAPMRTAAANANTGFGAIDAGVVNTPPPPDPNLQSPVSITFTTSGTFDVSGAGTGNPTGIVYASGGSITFNGWTVRISGSPRVGDVFTISANSGGQSDGRNALLLAGLQTQKTLAAGTATYQSAYSQMVSMVGNKTYQIDVASQAQDTLVSQATQAQQSRSGVNLDEEAANLLRYQQAYQAAGRMIQMSSTLFQTLLDLGR